MSNAPFEEEWNKLLRGILRVYQYESMKKPDWMLLYSVVYNCCTTDSAQSRQTGHVLSRESKQNRSQSNCQDDPNSAWEKLYNNMKLFLREHLEDFRRTSTELQGEDLLRFYTARWDTYQFSSKVTSGIFGYLNRIWVRLQYNSGRRHIYEIHTMALEMWLQNFFQPLNKSITRACLDLIRAERNHEVINTHLISTVIQSYVALGFAEDLDTANGQMIVPTLTIYKDCFEAQFLQDTEQYYRVEAATFLVHNSVTDYMKKVAQRLDEEVHRVQSYLHPSTSAALMTRVEEVLIRDQLDVMCAETIVLLQNEKHQELALLYRLMSRVHNGTAELKKILENYIYEMGINEIARVSETALTDANLYVETIIDIHKRFFQLIHDAFNSEKVFTTSLDKACGKFINHNAVTAAAGSTTKSPELLARYCDTLLRKGSKTIDDGDLEEKFNQIMVIFNYMDDKDVFGKFYSKMLAKRLIGQLSASNDYEESMITKLKSACGFEYTSSLQRMFQDMSVSKTLLDEYRNVTEREHTRSMVDFSVLVLSSNAWPLSTSGTFLVPIELQPTFAGFTDFYTRRHNGRKLTWLYQHSKGELQTYFTAQKYTLQVSTYQMVVLLLFNKAPTWTVEQLEDETQMKSDLLHQVLRSLLKSRLLKSNDICEQELDGDIRKTFTMRLATDFKSKKIRINLNQPLKSVEQKESEVVHQRIDDDRKMIIQAAIVRTMKARQTLKHALLVQEVIQQLGSHFKPTVPLIKKCIDVLIEKEYLERQSNEKEILRYLA